SCEDLPQAELHRTEHLAIERRDWREAKPGRRRVKCLPEQLLTGTAALGELQCGAEKPEADVRVGLAVLNVGVDGVEVREHCGEWQEPGHQIELGLLQRRVLGRKLERPANGVPRVVAVVRIEVERVGATGTADSIQSFNAGIFASTRA